MSWLRIDKDYFNTEKSEFLNFSDIRFTIDCNKNPKFGNYITNWIDDISRFVDFTNPNVNRSSIHYKKEISNNDFQGFGCFIKSVDYDNNSGLIHFEIMCDRIETGNISQLREDKLNMVLEKTSGE